VAQLSQQFLLHERRSVMALSNNLLLKCIVAAARGVFFSTV
jgi:hypothetical protein